MSMERNEFQDALSRLESMAKGGATQLHHTSSDSDPGTWAGTSTKDGQDEHNDGIDENGTDYNGVKKALAAKVEKSKPLTPAEVAIVKGYDPRPLIVEKISKGERLTQAESWALKGGIDKMCNSMHKGNDKPTPAGVPGEAKDAGSVPDSHGGDADEEIEADAQKSLASAMRQGANLSKGLEMSPILAEFARAMGTALQGVEARTAQRIEKSIASIVMRIGEIEDVLAKSVVEQGEFNKGFAETLVGVGQHVAGISELSVAKSIQPVGAPKSQFRAIPGGQVPAGVQPVQKSFAGGLDVGSDALAKSQVISAMAELVEKGRLNSLDVVKFEMTGEINPNVSQMVMAHVNGTR